jgi:hypothetical protein
MLNLHSFYFFPGYPCPKWGSLFGKENLKKIQVLHSFNFFIGNKIDAPLLQGPNFIEKIMFLALAMSNVGPCNNPLIT